MKNALIVIALGLTAACQEATPQSERIAAVVPRDSKQTVVDSVFPVEEEIRRFKSKRNELSATSLSGGSSSPDELMHRFIRAVATTDTAQLRRLAVNAAEFIDLYYPASIFAKPPFKQSPELLWFLIQENSNKGITRMLQRYGGKPLELSTYQCATERADDGGNKVWDRCTVTWNQQPSQMRIFSTIIGRDGRFKILSYANDL